MAGVGHADPVVTGEHEEAAHRVGVARHGYHHRPRERQQPERELEPGAQQHRRLLGEGGEDTQIEPTGEPPRPTGDQRNIARRLTSVERLVDTREHLERQSVGLAIVHGDHRHAIG